MRLQCGQVATVSMQKAFIALLLCGLSLTSSAATSTTPKLVGTTTTQTICPSRTVNYITHGLPQQCLTASRRSGTGGVDGTEYATAIRTAVDIANSISTPSTVEAPLSDSTIQLHPSTQSASLSTQVHSPSNSLSSLDTARPHESEDPSPLEGEKFMSFEEWKRQNLRKVGEADPIGKTASAELRGRKQPADIHNVLDSFGDDTEIDLDFSGFIPDGPELRTYPPAPQSSMSDSEAPAVQESSSPTGKRGKEAGTTSKERNNHVSFDCGATVLKTNPEAQSAGAVLGENKDYYMLNVCSAKNKFLILELCEDIAIDTIVLANFEFFSSIFHTFRVSVSDIYPVKIDKWKSLGTFEARNSRDVQAFLIDNPLIWARYLRFEFLTHYGSEYYCPVSLVRVHGETMLENLKNDPDQKGDDDEEQHEDEEDLPIGEPNLVPEDPPQLMLSMTNDGSVQTNREPTSTATEAGQLGNETYSSAVYSPSNTPIASSALEGDNPHSVSFTDLISVPRNYNHGLPPLPIETCAMKDAPQRTNGIRTTTTSQAETITPSMKSSAEISAVITPTSSTIPSQVANPDTATTLPVSSSDMLTTPQQSTKSTQTSVAHSKGNTNATSTDRPKANTSTSQAPAAIPTMQESFFKTVQKRLQMLEKNSSLSLEYIEDQSRALRDAFNRVEQRQLAKTTTFLEYLNSTVLSELRDFRHQYDQLWQSTVIELEMQRERYERENLAINARLGVLADELVFHKRMSILQMVLILVCLILVVFSKGAMNTYLEFPLVQSVLARSPSSKWLNVNNLETPSQSPHLKRTRSAQQLRNRHGILKSHRSMQSEDSIDGVGSLVNAYTPPTPTSFGDGSDYDPDKDEHKAEDPKFYPSTIERPNTSPPILPSSEISSPLTLAANGISDGETIDSRILYTVPPQMVLEEATPPPKHLKWNLPDS